VHGTACLTSGLSGVLAVELSMASMWSIVGTMLAMVTTLSCDGRVPGLATYTRLKVGRETGARYLHYTEVGTVSYYSLEMGNYYTFVTQK
jgi:hypothetical protein